jgi:hypothetical protein
VNGSNAATVLPIIKTAILLCIGLLKLFGNNRLPFSSRSGQLLFGILKCVIPVARRKTDGEVNISHENTTMVVWIYGGV